MRSPKRGSCGNRRTNRGASFVPRLLPWGPPQKATVSADGRLVGAAGRLVGADGRLVGADGRLSTRAAVGPLEEPRQLLPGASFPIRLFRPGATLEAPGIEGCALVMRSFAYPNPDSYKKESL